MSDETKEPAIPVIAPVPLRSHLSLLEMAARDWPQATQPGATLDVRITRQGVAVVGTLTLYDDLTMRVLAAREVDGHWEINGQLRWTLRQ